MTRFSILGIFVTILFISFFSIKGQADAVGSYKGTGAVGFTGKMPETPVTVPEVTLPPIEKEAIVPTLPNNSITVPNGAAQSVTLPDTGDTSNKVYFVTASIFVALIIFLLKDRLKIKVIKNSIL